MTTSSDPTSSAVAHDVVGVVRYRFERLPVYERRFTRSITVNVVMLGVLAVLAAGALALVAALGGAVLVLVPLLLLAAATPAWSLVAMRRFQRGLPRRGGPDVAIVVRRSGLVMVWPDLGPDRPVTFTWGDLAQVGVRGPALRVRAHRRPAGSWWRSAFVPLDLLDTPVDLILRDVHAWSGGHVRS
ncbi:hypothetical protein [Mumia sp. DW29H23]|uniref:hypothetical protein n=1 Tax=Mumia sp. DW29H23 TaxID=3421241 RepID=UPI003D68D258